MDNVVVTTGSTFTDIDGFACALAYADLLRTEGENAVAVLPGVLNASVTPTLLAESLSYETQPPVEYKSAVIVDVSEPDHIAEFVDQKKIREVFDHHVGFEGYWQSRIGDRSRIEQVGACATQIWEEIARRNNKICSQEHARLLAAAIVSNTLNFQAQITDKRDHQAYQELLPLTRYAATGWIEDYYAEQERGIQTDFAKALKNDTKLQDIPNLGLTVAIGQMELWDGAAAFAHQRETAEKSLTEHGLDHWFWTIPSIKDGKNYLFTKSEMIKSTLSQAISAKFDGEAGETDKLWLRKEILREIYKLHNR